MQDRPWPKGAVFTVGHSTLPIEAFIGLLQTYGVDYLLDIRTVPRSRHNPQFNSDALSRSLTEAGIAYRAVPELGGLRHPGRHEVIANRAQAIRWAVNHADNGCVLLAGCGAEAWTTGQEGLSTSDEAVARLALAEKLSSTASAGLSMANPVLGIFPPPSAGGVIR